MKFSCFVQPSWQGASTECLHVYWIHVYLEIWLCLHNMCIVAHPYIVSIMCSTSHVVPLGFINTCRLMRLVG